MMDMSDEGSDCREDVQFKAKHDRTAWGESMTGRDGEISLSEIAGPSDEGQRCAWFYDNL